MGGKCHGEDVCREESGKNILRMRQMAQNAGNIQAKKSGRADLVLPGRRQGNYLIPERV
jgi:hypothetical protein